MRTNSPVDSDFGVLNIEDVPPEVTSTEKLIAKMGNSDEWKIIKQHIETRISSYKTALFGEDLSGQPLEVIGGRYLSATAVVQELTALLKMVERTVEDVKKRSKV